MFPFLKEVDIDQFLAICQYKTYKNKEVIFKAGSTSRKAAFILTGVTRGYFINKEGVEKNLMIRGQGTFMGVPEWLFSNEPTKYTFETIMDCSLLVFNLVDLEEIAKKNMAIFEFYTWGLKDQLRILMYRIETMVDLSPEERYKDLLAKYPNLFQSAFNKHIANFLGITPVSLSRIIKRMKDHPRD